MKKSIYIVLAFILSSMPFTSQAFPGMKSKAEFLPLFHAFATQKESISLKGVPYTIEYPEGVTSLDVYLTIEKFLAEGLGDHAFSTRDMDIKLFEQLLKQINNILHLKFDEKALSEAYQMIHSGQGATSSTSLDQGKDLSAFKKAIRKEVQSDDKHVQKEINSLRNLTSLKNFDFINKVGTGKVKQRYRIKIYESDAKKYLTLDFFLRGPAGMADKDKSKPKKAKDEKKKDKKKAKKKK